MNNAALGSHISAAPELLLVLAASPPLLEPRGDVGGLLRLLAPFSSFSMELVAYPARDVLLALQMNNIPSALTSHSFAALASSKSKRLNIPF